MKVEFNRKELASALASVGAAVDNRSATPHGPCVHFAVGDAATLTATDFNLTVRTSVSCVAEKKGAALIPHAKLSGIVSADWGESVTVDVGSDHVAKVTTDNSRFRISGQNPDCFPDIVIPDKSPRIVDAAAFAQALRQCAFAAVRSGDSKYDGLKGVCFDFKSDSIAVVASDTHRISLVTISTPGGGKNDKQEVVHLSGITLAAKLAANAEKVTITTGGTAVAFAIDEDTVISTQCLAAQFPRYVEVIPEDLPCSVTVDRKHMLDALNLVSQASNPESHSVLLAFNGSRCSLSSESFDAGVVELAARSEGEAEISFAYDLLVQALSACNGEEVDIRINDAKSPLRFDEGNFTHAIMPIVSKNKEG